MDLRKRTRIPGIGTGIGIGTAGNGANPMGVQPQTTGRYLVLVRDDAIDDGLRTIRDRAGAKIASTFDFPGGAYTPDQVAGADAVFFDKLAVAVVSGEPDQIRGVQASAQEGGAILAVEPERVVYALTEAPPAPPLPLGAERPVANGGASPLVGLPQGMLSDLLQQQQQQQQGGMRPELGRPGLTVQYLVGYRDAIDNLIDSLASNVGARARLALGLRSAAAGVAAPGEAVTGIDETLATWGLQVTGATQSQFNGRGVRVAILDTGIDPQHPDFAGRSITTHSFVPDQTVQDGHGHGTHVAGTACGPLQPAIGPRYGIAYAADLTVGKVLNDQGWGVDEWILAGINWAVTQKCRAVNLSLGSPATPGEAYSKVYEHAARRALNRGTLIIAAAGNDSRRDLDTFQPVSRPANCPSIVAVGAIDAQFQLAYFSNRGINPRGGQVDVVAPGVDVYSAAPSPVRYRRMSGTSMATPHVTGLAALHAQAGPIGCELWRLLMQSARRLELSSADVGAGLVQAP